MDPLLQTLGRQMGAAGNQGAVHPISFLWLFKMSHLSPGNNFKSCWVYLALDGGGSLPDVCKGRGDPAEKIRLLKEIGLTVRGVWEKRSQEPDEANYKIPIGWEKPGGREASGMQTLCLGFKQKIFRCRGKREGVSAKPSFAEASSLTPEAPQKPGFCPQNSLLLLLLASPLVQLSTKLLDMLSPKSPLTAG